MLRLARELSLAFREHRARHLAPRDTAGGKEPPCGPPWRAGSHAWASRGRWETPAPAGVPPGQPGHPFWRAPRRARSLRRATEGRIVGGVAEGISRRFGIEVTIVRIAFVLACLASFGLPLYTMCWLLIPNDEGEPSIAVKAIGDRRGIALVLALVPLLVAGLLLASALRAGWLSSFIWPAFFGLGVLVLIFRNAPAAEQAVLRSIVGPVVAVGMPTRSRTQVLLWASAGAACVAGGLVLLLHHHTRAVLWPIGGVLLVLAGVVVIFGPWWLRIARDLVLERQARARAEERADMAARVHDSVLQTLALIQRQADEPARVVALARAQERELRSWLFEGRPPGSLGDEAASFSTALESIQQDVEAQHRMKVETVVVGDCGLDEDVDALLAAAKEAIVNAAKWSGAGVVSVFAEVADDAISVFVRDRGRGFLPSDVGSDRRGVSDSIEGRMARHGGTATIRSAPGEGTEVSLELPREGGKAREPHGSMA